MTSKLAKLRDWTLRSQFRLPMSVTPGVAPPRSEDVASVGTVSLRYGIVERSLWRLRNAAISRSARRVCVSIKASFRATQRLRRVVPEDETAFLIRAASFRPCRFLSFLIGSHGIEDDGIASQSLRFVLPGQCGALCALRSVLDGGRDLTTTKERNRSYGLASSEKGLAWFGRGSRHRSDASRYGPLHDL
jgi:hypothetical protein